MHRSLCVILALVLTLCADVANATPQKGAPCDEGNVHDSRILRSTVAVLGPDMVGSGVLISSDEVLMSAHVASNKMGKVIIVTCDWEHINGKVFWIDEALDLALIKIDKQLADHFVMKSRSMVIGERVMTVGQPDGIPWAMSTGVVTQTNKMVMVKQSDGRVRGYYLIVTSAYSNAGGSGGALVDDHGALAGIIVAVTQLNQDRSVSFAQSIVNFCIAYNHPFCRSQ